MALSTPTVNQLFGGLPASQQLDRFDAFKAALSKSATESDYLRSRGLLHFDKQQGIVKKATPEATAVDALVKSGASEETISLFKGALAGDTEKAWSNTTPLNWDPGNVGFTPIDVQSAIEFLVPVMTPLRNAIPRRAAQGQAARILQVTGYSNSRTGGVANLNTFFNSQTNTASFNGLNLNRPNTISYNSDALVVPFVEQGVSDLVELSAQYAAQGYTDLRQMSNTAAIYSHMLGEENNILNSTSAPLNITGITAAAVAGGTQTGLPAGSVTAVNITFSSAFGESQGLTATGTAFTITAGQSIEVTPSAVPVGTLGINVYATIGATSYVGRTPLDGALATPTIWTVAPVQPSRSADNGSSPQYQFGGTLLGTAGYTGLISTLVGNNTTPAAAGYVKAVNGAFSTVNPFIEVNTMLVELWESNRAQPDTLYTSGRIQAALLQLIQQQGSPTSYRAEYMTGDDGIIVGGAVTGITSPVGGPQLKIVAHPFMPEGVVIAHSNTLPSPVSGVPGTCTVDNVVDLTTINWPQIQMSWDISTYQLGAFVFHTPAFDGILTNVITNPQL